MRNNVNLRLANAQGNNSSDSLEEEDFSSSRLEDEYFAAYVET